MSKEVWDPPIPCGACRMLIRSLRWRDHSPFACAREQRRLHKIDGLDPMTRMFLRITPPNQVTWLGQDDE